MASLKIFPGVTNLSTLAWGRRDKPLCNDYARRTPQGGTL